MRTRTLGRLGAAAVVALGLMCATALPASATVHSFHINASSTIGIGTATTVHTTTTSNHPTTNICAKNSLTNVGTLATDLDSTGGGTVTGSTAWGDIHLSNSTYYEVRLLINAGTITVTPTTITVNLTIVAEFANCSSTPIVCRTNPATITSTGANPSGSLHPGASTSTTLSGTSSIVTTQIGCNVVVRAAINGFSANAALNVHLTT